MREKIKTGLFWVFFAQAWGQILQTATALILAAILLPVDFGIFALAGIIIGWLGLLKSLGFDSALVYERGDNKEMVNAAFWILQISGFGLWLVAILLAGPAAVFFAEPRIKYIIMIVGVSFPLTSLRLVHGALLQKELEIKKNSWPAVISGLVGAVATIISAIAGLRYWSLVIGGLLGGIVTVITYWCLCSFRPHWPVKWKEAGRLWHFGSIAAVNNILIFMNQIIDNAFVGKLLGSTQLGFYDFAYRMGNAPCTRITMPIYQVVYPAFIKAKEESPDKLKHIYLNTIRYLSYLVLPLAAVIIAVGPFFFNLLYGNKWNPSMQTMRVLVIYGLIAALAGPVGTLFYALGRPQNLLYIDAAKMITVVSLAYFAVKQGGILGVAILFTSASLLYSLIAVLWGNRLIKISNASYLNVLQKQLISSGVVGIIVWVWLRADGGAVGWWGWLKLFLALLFFMVSYGGLLLLLDRNVRKIWGKLKKGINTKALMDIING